ncbi:hypothetical protein ACISIN_05360, partial [Campylobacter coli]
FKHKWSYESEHALGGSDRWKRDRLKPMGVLYFCYEALALDKICLVLESKKLKLTKIRFVHTHQNISARLVLVQARKSVKSPCEILPPFFIYKNENLSEQMQEIHSRFRLESYDI